MWNLVICDDEEVAIDAISKEILKLNLSRIESIVSFANGEELLRAAMNNPRIADIVLLDIKLQSVSGIEIAERLLEINPKTQIIFMSGYDEYYQAIYRVEHAYFIHKPVSETMLAKALNASIRRLDKQEKRSFFISNKGGQYAIAYSDITYFEKDKRKIIARTVDDQQYEYYGKMEETLNRLNGDFFRCHNSFVINLAYIKSMEHGTFVMSDERCIPISRTYIKEAKEKFARYICK
ncbi:MAG TPA: LytTR family DNA-binding domain-containing protein [Anaerovoracaceae bacterium]|nr:LytTR family DNA-binding domain-containing protein [Anaerovoracaceae bacterium]